MAAPLFAGNQLKNTDGTITIANAITPDNAVTLIQMNAAIATAVGALAATTPVLVNSQIRNALTDTFPGVIAGAFPTDGIYQLSVMITINSIVASTAQITFTYVDENGTTQVQNITTVLAATGAYLLPTVTVQGQNTGAYTVDVVCSASPTIDYDVSATLLFMKIV